MGKDTNGRKLSPQEEARIDLHNMQRAADEVQKYCQKHGGSVVITSEGHTLCKGDITVPPSAKKR
ncbi:hypothetical protein J6V86_01080 [bacterium]|nr:hypothetical protein [bacterium]